MRLKEGIWASSQITERSLVQIPLSAHDNVCCRLYLQTQAEVAIVSNTNRDV